MVWRRAALTSRCGAIATGFPQDFIFELTPEEFANLKSQSATSSWGGRRKLPLAFTEHGAIMAATVLEKLNPRAKRQLTQLLDTFIEGEKLKRRVGSNADS